jgi:hypothetical protein
VRYEVLKAVKINAVIFWCGGERAMQQTGTKFYGVLSQEIVLSLLIFYFILNQEI